MDDFSYSWSPHQDPNIATSEGIRYTNIERLLDNPLFAAELASGFRYDVIASGRTFEHLQDPLGALVQAYALLAHGGILAIDMLVLHGIDDIAASPGALLHRFLD